MATIKISKNNNVSKVSIFDKTGMFIREVPVKLKNPYSGKWDTEYVDIRTMKIGSELDGGIVVENTFLEN